MATTEKKQVVVELYDQFINAETQAETPVPTSSVLVNDPSKLSFIVPATLEKGDYQLSVTTQFSSSGTQLKEPRTYTFEYVLTVIDDVSHYRVTPSYITV